MIYNRVGRLSGVLGLPGYFYMPCDPHQITTRICPLVSSFDRHGSSQSAYAETNEKAVT